MPLIDNNPGKAEIRATFAWQGVTLGLLLQAKLAR